MYFAYHDKSLRSGVHSLSNWWTFFCVSLVLLLGYLSRHRLLSLPEDLTVNDLETHPDSFIAERAWHDLNILTSFGTRPTGSHANEALAVDFFKRELSYIQKNADPSQKIYGDLQKVSGSYFIEFKPHSMTNVYRSVQNFIVKLVGSEEDSSLAHHTLMLNCHFDSVAGSPGASDDAASCCVMLEILRVLSQQKTRLKHTVLFLFNGAEETPLQAAHGFITQHEWAKNIRAFLNLESVGSNGKEILFQSGPKHGWLIEMYKNAVPYPNGQCAGEELFQSGVIPSDTDFRIFRDFGHIPGMDFAHVMYGYRYHTKYDHIDYIPPSVLQRTGENILALVRVLANSEQLAHTKAYEADRMVYYDLLGFYFVAYSEGTGQILNVVVALSSIIISYFLIQAKGIKPHHVQKELFKGFIFTLLSVFLGAGLCYLIAIEIDFSGHAMSWYNRTYFTIILYSLPSVAVHAFFYAGFFHESDSSLSLGLKTQARIIGVNTFWALVTLAITFIGYRTAYAFMLLNLIHLIISVAIAVFKAQNTSKTWLYIHLIGQVFVILWTTHTYHLYMSVFIPLSGRSGGHINPDIAIAVLVSALTMFITSFLIPLVGLLRKPKYLLYAIIVTFAVTRISFIGTHVSFPYSDDKVNPTPQRHFITHAVRKVYNEKGELRFTDSGYWFREMDRNILKTIEGLTVPHTPVPQEEIPLCQELPFCGLPLFTTRQLYTGGYWLPGPVPLVKNEAELKLLSKDKLTETEYQMKLSINGSYLYSLQIRPKPGVELIKWNLLKEVPEKNNAMGFTGYIVLVTHGLEAPPLKVDLAFSVKDKNHKGPLADITVVTQFWEFTTTPAFAQLLSRVPSWAFAVPSVSSLQSWIF